MMTRGKAGSPLTGSDIRSYREAAKLSQQEFASAVGVSMRSVSRWENDNGLNHIYQKAIRDYMKRNPPPKPTDGMPTNSDSSQS